MPTFEIHDHGIFQGASIGHFHKMPTAFKGPLVTKSYSDKLATSIVCLLGEVCKNPALAKGRSSSSTILQKLDVVEFNDRSLSKEAVTLATTFIHKVQLYELSQRTIWYPITAELIAARLKCPRIQPNCFEEAEE